MGKIFSHNGQVNRVLLILKNEDVRQVLDRMQLLLGVKNDSELAAALGINRSTMGSWVSREAVPYAICVSLAAEKGASLDWLLSGVGPMLRGGSAPSAAMSSGLSPREEAILGLLRGLDEADQRDIQSAAEEKKRLRQIEQRLQELTNALAVGVGGS